MSHPIRSALVATVTGLQEMINSNADSGLFADDTLSLTHMAWMCDQILDNIDHWPLDKTGRWIGFIQGVLACHQILDVASERDRTRPLFHAAYLAAGENVPKTLDRSQQ